MKVALVILLLILSACEVTSEPPKSATERAESPATPDEPEVEYRRNTETILLNTGTTALEYGNDFTLERKTRVGWKTVEQPDDSRIFCAWTSEAHLLQPGDEIRQEISVCDRNGQPEPLKPGRYRVNKTVRHPAIRQSR